MTAMMARMRLASQLSGAVVAGIEILVRKRDVCDNRLVESHRRWSLRRADHLQADAHQGEMPQIMM